VAEPAATPPGGALPLDVEFSANAHDVDGPPEDLTYFWLFGDGSYSTDENPDHAFIDPGTYTVWLNVFDGVGDTSEELTLEVDPAEVIPGVPADLPARLALKSPYPNPFNPRVLIGFVLPVPTRVSLSVYDLAGRLVATLVNQDLAAGEHSVLWQGVDGSGRGVPAGGYIVQMVTPEGRDRRKVMLVR
jgi:PKD repeat protein